MTAKKIISLPTNEDKVYKQILSFLNFILKISPQQIDVLGEIIRLNNEYEALPNPQRAKFIWSTDMRKEVREKLGIEEKQYNGIFLVLKEKLIFGEPILDKDGVINKILILKPDNEGFRIEINLVNTIVKQTESISSLNTVSNTIDKEEEDEEESNPYKANPEISILPISELKSI